MATEYSVFGSRPVAVHGDRTSLPAVQSPSGTGYAGFRI